MESVSPMKLVREDIRKVESRMRSLPVAASGPLASTLKDLLGSGGKRIRPTLTVLFGRLLSVPDDPLFFLAAAVEVVHTATLVHDDLIDNSILRRGKPTPNAKGQPATAVLIGDLLFAWAAQLAAATKSTPVMQCFASALTTVVTGEIAQTFSPILPCDLDGYLRRIEGKTAALFSAACESPGLLAGRPLEARLAAEYGRNFGIAFQMADDILDYAGKTTDTGKPTGSDLRQGLITLPAICYRQENPRDADLKALLAGNHGRVDTERLLQSIRKSTAIEGARAIAEKYAAKAASLLPRLPSGPHRDALEQLTLTIVERQS